MRKEPVPFNLPIVNQYEELAIPPIPFPWYLKEHENEPYITRELVCMIRFSKETNEEVRSRVMKTNVKLETFIQQLNPLYKFSLCLHVPTTKWWMLVITLASNYVGKVVASCSNYGVVTTTTA
nr:hypothetical protein [Tanacetum cinerariifolium]